MFSFFRLRQWEVKLEVQSSMDYSAKSVCIEGTCDFSLGYRVSW
ncbi:hypothetical protein AB205_0028950, partial [Aquarana catesbeiana]